MPARSPSDGGGDGERADRAGQFGPASYTAWRGTSLGSITEALERRLVLRLVGPVAGQAVLDVGCGDGALSEALRQAGAARVAGCDPDPRMVARARIRASGTDPGAYAVARAEHLPYRDATFDLATMVTVLAFVPDPAAALREIARVLKPGGRLVIADLGRWSLWALSRRVRGWLGAALWRSARFRTAGRLRTLAQSAGFRVEEVAGAVYYPRSAVLARVMAPVDSWLGARTTVGAAVVALRVRGTAEAVRSPP